MRWREYVPPKRRLAYGLHGVVPQKMSTFNSYSVMTVSIFPTNTKLTHIWRLPVSRQFSRIVRYRMPYFIGNGSAPQEMESSIYSSIWPVFYCSKLLGATTLKRCGNQLQWSWAQAVYNFLYFMPCAAFTFITPLLMIMGLKTSITVSQFLEIFNCALAGLSGLISLAISLRKSRALPSLLDEFRRADVSYLLTPPRSNRNVVIYFTAHLLIVISIYTAAVTILCWKNTDVVVVTMTLCLTLAQMYLVVAEMQFVCLCYALTERYKHINNCIKKLYNSKLEKNNLSISKPEDGREIYVTLTKLRRGHRCLYDIGKKLNGMYAAQMFVSVFACFTLTVFCWYYGIMYYNTDEYIPAGMFASGAQYFVRFFIINCCCQNTSDEVRLVTTIQFMIGSCSIPPARNFTHQILFFFLEMSRYSMHE
jgi:hypothetical protein